jgi:hypothetical protein
MRVFKTTLIYEGLETRFYHAREDSAHTFFKWLSEVFAGHPDFDYQVKFRSEVDTEKEDPLSSYEKARRESIWALWEMNSMGVKPTAH